MNLDTEKSFASILENAQKGGVYWEELAILGFTRGVLERLEALGLTKKILAEKLEVSPAYVTKLIGGSNNFTLRTMVKIARVLESELQIKLAPVEGESCAYTTLFHEMNCPSQTAVDHDYLALAA
jgi:Helix-turn-helix